MLKQKDLHHWPASLANLSSGFSERFCLKKIGGEQKRSTLETSLHMYTHMFTPSLHMYTHMFAPSLHMYTHTCLHLASTHVYTHALTRVHT